MLGKDAVTMASKTMAQALGRVRTEIGAPVKAAPRRLTPGEQFNRFLKMRDRDFDVLRSKYGDRSVNDYVDAMVALAGRYM